MRDRISRRLAHFDDRTLDTIEYRASLDPSPDGFPSNTRYGPREGGRDQHTPVCPATEGGECECGVAYEETTPTERAALRLIEGANARDPQQTACERIDLAFRTIWHEVDAAEHAWDVILHASDSIREREAQSTLGTCQACLADDVPNMGDDRIKAGYCPACYKAWQRTDTGQGRQDRRGFELSRRRLHVVSEEPRTGYAVDELDGLVAAGVLPSPRHAASGDMGTGGDQHIA